NPCNVINGTCPYDFVDDEDWSSWSPKVGATYHLQDGALIYGFWTRGYRSGGYNLRNTSLDLENLGPGPFDEEQVDTYEIGFKAEFERGRLNGAVFYTEIDNMQRELNLPDPSAGIVQVIKNTADAELPGFELDGTYNLTDSLILNASVGYVDASYTAVFFDLNGDGVVDKGDEDLDLPRAAKWTYAASLLHDLDVGEWGTLTSRLSYAYRDDSAYTDNNRGFLLDREILDAGLDLYSNDGHWVFSLYARNLLDDVAHGADSQLPDTLGPVPLGGTAAPLSKGRRYGVEVTYAF
ncbi:MAG: TonB-dependent receptor, partial [Pseudomonadota bacterium]